MPSPEPQQRRRTRSLSVRISALERRLSYLQRKLDDPNRRQSSRDYDAGEAGALKLAIEALRRYHAEYQTGTTAVELLGKLRALLDDLNGATPGTPELLDTIEVVDLFLSEAHA